MLTVVRLALSRPYTFVVMAILIAILGVTAIITMPVDIFPYIDIPIVSVLWQYSGLSPEEMEKRVVTQFERGLTSNVNDIEHIEATLRRCVEAASATLLHIHLHHFQPSGVSGVAVLAESHISIHTWPEIGYAALDVFMCGSADPDKCIPVLREAFSAERVGVNELLRGQDA